MKNKLCLKQWIPSLRNKAFRALLLTAALAASAGWCRGGVPDWFRAATRVSLPTYPEAAHAVVLLDENQTTVKDTGDMETVYRRVIKILRPEGREHGTMAVNFDKDTRLAYLKGWSISARGEEYEVKEKDAIETALFAESLYSDLRHKLLSLPAVEPGAVVGYEYVQKRRSMVFQDLWTFQDQIPVRRARYVLRMAPGWEYSTVWLNFPEQPPQTAGPNEWVWELENLEAVESEPSMPTWYALAARLALSFFSSQKAASGKSHASWSDVGAWYSSLVAGRREPSPEIKQKVKELAASAPSELDKIRALATFVQREIRYVAIEIGIGGHQPHPAPEVFANRYGDCKDKATLLSAMLREAGIESYYVLVRTDRGVVVPQFASVIGFDHVILGIRLPEGVPTAGLHSMVEHEKLGKLLLFDPTDSLTPLGYVAAHIQATQGLVVTEGGGEFLQLPLLAPTLNRLLRSATLNLRPDGNLEGSVQEILWGGHAARLRRSLLAAPANERAGVLEHFLGEFLGGLVFQSAQAENLENCASPLILRYKFMAKNYAKTAGELMLVRPRVLGQKARDWLEGKERKHPVEFPSASLETDMFEIALPAGFKVDELPPAVTADCGFVDYKSETKVEGNTLKYQRSTTIKSVHIPKDRLGELKAFYRRVAGDDRNSAVLRRTPS